MQIYCLLFLFLKKTWTAVDFVPQHFNIWIHCLDSHSRSWNDTTNVVGLVLWKLPFQRGFSLLHNHDLAHGCFRLLGPWNFVQVLRHLAPRHCLPPSTAMQSPVMNPALSLTTVKHSVRKPPWPSTLGTWLNKHRDYCLKDIVDSAKWRRNQLYYAASMEMIGMKMRGQASCHVWAQYFACKGTCHRWLEKRSRHFIFRSVHAQQWQVIHKQYSFRQNICAVILRNEMRCATSSGSPTPVSIILVKTRYFNHSLNSITVWETNVIRPIEVDWYQWHLWTGVIGFKLWVYGFECSDRIRVYAATSPDCQVLNTLFSLRQLIYEWMHFAHANPWGSRNIPKQAAMRYKKSTSIHNILENFRWA